MKRGYIRYLSLAMGLLACSQISIASADIYPGTNIVWNPGHYWAIHKEANLATPYAQERIARVIGVSKPYFWKNLEKTKGVYDFTQIEKDLALMNSKGKKLIVQIMDKSFVPGEVAIPNYLVNSSNPQYSPEYRGGHTRNFQGGYTTKKWIPAVNARLQAFYAALGARFNGRVEAVQIQETATSLRGTLTPADYSAAAYTAGTIANMRALKAAFRNTVVQQMFNGMPTPENISQVFAAARADGISISTVDTNPLDARQWDRYYKYFLPFSSGLNAPIGAMVVNANFKIGTINEISAATMANFSINKLGANYIFWSAINTAKRQEIYRTIPLYKTVLQK